MKKYLYSTFDNAYTPTILDKYLKEYQLQDTTLVVEFIEPAGQENFQAFRKPLYEGVDVIILAYSCESPTKDQTGQLVTIGGRESQQNVKTLWLPEIRKNVPKSVPIVLLGTKLDLYNRKTDSFGATFADDLVKRTKAYLHFRLSSQYGVSSIKDMFISAISAGIANCNLFDKKFKPKKNNRKCRLEFAHDLSEILQEVNASVTQTESVGHASTEITNNVEVGLKRLIEYLAKQEEDLDVKTKLVENGNDLWKSIKVNSKIQNAILFVGQERNSLKVVKTADKKEIICLIE